LRTVEDLKNERDTGYHLNRKVEKMIKYEKNITSSAIK